LISLRIILPLTAAAMFTFACGPWSRGAEHEGAVRHTRVASTKGTSFGSALDVRIKDDVEFALTVTNNAKRAMELRFPDGRTHDFAVLDHQGRVVWQWSEGRMFTSAMQTRLMKSGNSVRYHSRWDPPARRGNYVAVATLRSTNHPVSTQVQFTLP
jgi:hypothetical protein